MTHEERRLFDDTWTILKEAERKVRRYQGLLLTCGPADVRKEIVELRAREAERDAELSARVRVLADREDAQ